LLNLYKNIIPQLVAVDCAIFGYENEELKILLSHRKLEPGKGNWSLIGGFIQEDESLEDAAERIVLQITGLSNIFMEQVATFSKLNRDPGARVISTGFYALIRIDQYAPLLKVEEYDARWIPVTQIPELVFDHNEIVQKAFEKLQILASIDLVGKALLPEKFTLKQLRSLYESFFQRSLDPGNFRKKIHSLNALERLDEKNTEGSKKGAYYFRFKEDDSERIFNRVIKI